MLLLLLLTLDSSLAISITGDIVNINKFGNQMVRNRTITFTCTDSDQYGILQVPGGTVEVLCQPPQLVFSNTLVAYVPRQIVPFISQMYLTTTPDQSIQQLNPQTDQAPLLRKLLQAFADNGQAIAQSGLLEGTLPAQASVFGFAIGSVACAFGTCGGISAADIRKLQNQITALDAWKNATTAWAAAVTLYQEQNTAILSDTLNASIAVQNNIDTVSLASQQQAAAIQLMTQSNANLFNQAQGEMSSISAETQNISVQLEAHITEVAAQLLNASNQQINQIALQVNSSIQVKSDNFQIIQSDMRAVGRMIEQLMLLHQNWFNSVYFSRQQTANVWNLLNQAIEHDLVPILDPNAPGRPPASSLVISLINSVVDISFINFVYSNGGIPTIASHRITLTCDTIWSGDNINTVSSWRSIMDWIGTMTCDPLSVNENRTCQCWITDDFEECQLSPTSSIQSWQASLTQQFFINETNNCVSNTRNAGSINYYTLDDWHSHLGTICNSGTTNNTDIRIFDQGLSQLIDILPPNLIGIDNVCDLDANSALNFPEDQPTIIFSMYKFWELSLQAFVSRLPQALLQIYGFLPIGTFQEREDYTRTASGSQATADYQEFVAHDNLSLPVFDLYLSQTIPSVSVQRATDHIADGSAIFYTPDVMTIDALENIPSPFRVVSNEQYFSEDGLIYDVPMKDLPLTFNARQASFTPMYYAHPIDTSQNLTSANLPPPMDLNEWKSLYGLIWEPLAAGVSSSLFARATIGALCDGTLRCAPPQTTWNELCLLYEQFDFICSNIQSQSSSLTLIPHSWSYEATVSLPEGPISIVIEGNCPAISTLWYNDGTLDLIVTNPSSTTELTFQLGWNAGCIPHQIQIVSNLYTLRIGEVRNIPIQPVCQNSINVSAFAADNTTGLFTKSCLNNNETGIVTYTRNSTGLVESGILPSRLDIVTVSTQSVDPVIQGLTNLIENVNTLALQLTVMISPSMLQNLLINGTAYAEAYSQLIAKFTTVINGTFQSIISSSNLTISSSAQTALDALFLQLQNSSLVEQQQLNDTQTILDRLAKEIVNQSITSIQVANLTTIVEQASANLTRSNDALLAQLAHWNSNLNIDLPNIISNCGVSVSCWLGQILALLISIIAIALTVISIFVIGWLLVKICIGNVETGATKLAQSGTNETLEQVKNTKLTNQAAFRSLNQSISSSSRKPSSNPPLSMQDSDLSS